MNLLSINVGLPREINWKNRVVLTGIFKEPVSGRIHVRPHNLDGDRQADLRVHGGPQKAVYAYPSEHYEFWRAELPDAELLPGAFGENLTISGLREDDVLIGDHYRIGSSVLMVTQPRQPCFKLAAKFGRDDIIKRFLDSGRSGFYLAVIEAGEIGAGDAIELLGRAQDSLSIATVFELFVHGSTDRDLLARAAQLASLPASWRKHFRERLAALAN